MTSITCSNKHVWRDLAPDFSCILDGIQPPRAESAAVSAAYDRIAAHGRRAAVRFLSQWRVPDAETEAEDVVQQWLLILYDCGFARCDPTRRVHAFAYQILRRTCIKVLKTQLSNRARSLPVELSFERADWLTAVTYTEDLATLKRACESLPAMVRKEVELSLAEPVSHHLDKRSRHRRANLLWRARQRLRSLLRDELNLPGREEFREVG